ncbi:DNA methyltransferase [Actinoplanes sp. TFC3]|uniref:DNA methyltransferase n=1 Tax=Actinoplanes sp. TFC3 TaxID=1710355 RepID=UPI00191C03D6|nr:DNA methyltransferase [Actinoplanes sp. TFC3]
MPWRVAFALQAAGWTLRNAVVWAKTNPMPESVRDRLSTSYELLFLLTRSWSYYFDLDPIRIPLQRPDAVDGTRIVGPRLRRPHQPQDQRPRPVHQQPRRHLVQPHPHRQPGHALSPPQHRSTGPRLAPHHDHVLGTVSASANTWKFHNEATRNMSDSAPTVLTKTEYLRSRTAPSDYLHTAVTPAPWPTRTGAKQRAGRLALGKERTPRGLPIPR